MSEIVTITAYGRSYRIVNPGEGRVGSKLSQGQPYERVLLQDCYQQGYTGSAFDVGAHIGNHTLYLAAICGLSVHAWEPHRDSRAALEANLALNPDLSVTVYGWGAGRAENVGRLTRGKWIEFDPTRDGAKITLGRGDTPIRRIDDELDVPDLSVMKVDVEGMEADVIEGALGHIERSRPAIYAETHRRTDHDRVAAHLEPLGYRVTRTMPTASPMERWQHVG